MTCSRKPSPINLLTFYNVEQIEDDIRHLWRGGSRHPLLIRQLLNVWPGLPLDSFNEAASIAWDRLSPEELAVLDRAAGILERVLEEAAE